MKHNLFLFLLLALCLSFAIKSAETDHNKPISSLLLQWKADLQLANTTFSNPDLDTEALIHLREQLIEIRDSASDARNKINLEINSFQDQIITLSPPPVAGAPAESDSISRKSLNDRLAGLQEQLKQTDLVISGSDDTLKHLSVLQIQLFTKKIFSRGLSALNPKVWEKGIPEFCDKLIVVKNQFTVWQSAQTSQFIKSTFIHLTVTLLIIFVFIWTFSQWFSRIFGRTSKAQMPTYLELLRAALAFVFDRSLLLMSLTISGYLVLNHEFQWSESWHDFANAVVLALLMVILVVAVSRAMLAPFDNRWRLMPLNDADAIYVHKVIVGLAWVFAIDLVVKVWFDANGASVELTILRQFWVGLFITVLLFALLMRRQLWRMDIQHRRKISNKSMIWRSLRALIAFLALMIPVSAIAGYVAFSRLLGTQIVLTGALYVLLSIFIALCNDLIEELLSKDAEIGDKIRHNLDLSEEGAEMLAFWLKAVATTVIYVCAILTLLVIWGAGGDDISTWLYSAFFGFKVAGVTFSISTLFLAILVLSGILLLTRLLQRFLERVILPRTRFDLGIQNSIRAAVGYIGFVLAAGMAISTLGIDLSKLAIIVGALSVGIGFGLQNIVNNFVSGLILLIERPIKLGDWVIVNDLQGYVKSINVRATEIQTFDQASVFIPNSNLISNPLLNWTHSDKTGRVVVPVGVAYGTDTHKVKNLLLESATAHSAVLNSMPPVVLFKGFGDSCLNFELRVFVKDISKMFTINSDLCFAIDAAFRKEGIEIPYPQQDVHWKDMERLENLIAKIMSSKMS